MSPYEVNYVSFFSFFIYKTMFLLDVCAYRQRSVGEHGVRPLKRLFLDQVL